MGQAKKISCCPRILFRLRKVSEVALKSIDGVPEGLSNEAPDPITVVLARAGEFAAGHSLQARGAYVGIDTDGVGEPDPPLAARGGCDRMDRQLVLFHPSRPQFEAARRPARGRLWRSVAGPWRRLLPDHEVPGGACKNAGRTDLVQMGGLHDLAVRHRADGRGLLSRRRTV